MSELISTLERRNMELTDELARVKAITVFSDITAERKRQNDKWGEQNHDDFVWAAILGEEVGEANQAALHDRFGGSHAGTLREELIHAAAVIVQWIECMDGRELSSVQK